MGGDQSSSSINGVIGVVLARIIVPLYFAFGAVLKIADTSASHLPVALVKWMGALDINLMYVFRLSIAVELLVVGVMVLVPRLARPVGLFLMGIFLPVIIGDLALGASSCGCFGGVQVPPWVTLVIDGGLFLGLWWFGRHAQSLAYKKELPTLQLVVAGLWVVASFMIGFSAGGAAFGGAEPGGNSSAESGSVSLPADGYHMPDYEAWIGSSWDDVPISTWITGEEVLGTAVEYVMFYRKDCEHCHELMEAWFADEPPGPTLAVSVPERGGYPTENLQAFACDSCRLAELPLGVDWFLQTPILARLRDGVVECVAEVTASDPQCIEF